MSVLRNIYSLFSREDRTPLWREFAAAHQGTYAPAGDEKALIPHKGFMITFDAYTHYTVAGSNSYEAHYTRGVVEFPYSDNFRLLLTEQGFIENIGKFFGAQDIVIGDRQLDKKFIVKSNDEPKTIAFLAGTSIRTALQELPVVRFTITDGEGLWNECPKESHCMLYCVIDGKATNIGELHALHRLFANALDTLIDQYRIRPAR